MTRLVLALSLLVAGCSSILGFTDPQRRDDGGVMTADDGGERDASVDDASPDASLDAGVDGPVSASGGFTETAQGGALSFTGSLSIQTTCAANGICATGGFVK